MGYIQDCSRQKGILSPGNKDLESHTRQAAETSIKDAACKGDIFPIVTIEIPNGTC